MNPDMIVIGASAGGLQALTELLIGLPNTFSQSIIIVQHLSAEPTTANFSTILEKLIRHTVKEIEEKLIIEKGMIYTAPPNYHVTIERDKSFSLSVDEAINYARPSIDVLFWSAAQVYQHALVGIILTGANRDGAKGLSDIDAAGGVTMIQAPSTAEAPAMPTAALQAVPTAFCGDLNTLKLQLNKILLENK